MIRIKSRSEIEQYYREDREEFLFPDCVIFDLPIEIDGSVLATGYIKTRWFTRVSGSIESGLYIEAGDRLEAGKNIKAVGPIKANARIKTGKNIETEACVFSYMFEIQAKRISTNLLPLWRSFWAEMFPLGKWKEQILNDNLCWQDLRALPTKKEQIEICSWEGWHWILRGQLECFFGIRKSFSPPRR